MHAAPTQINSHGCMASSNNAPPSQLATCHHIICPATSTTAQQPIMARQFNKQHPTTNQTLPHVLNSKQQTHHSHLILLGG
ncbi:hypothetical protein Scep_012564 [Stephania cephalantha]|uniref:Uncharacterized protein n=1 Tax=Stephania cephalantha TaxID=152367 RepID=A0AAP0JGP9_9MAGN